MLQLRHVSQVLKLLLGEVVVDVLAIEYDRYSYEGRGDLVRLGGSELGG